MKYILITDIQYRKEFDTISMVKRLFPNDKIILGTTKGICYSWLCYGRCIVERLRTEGTFQAFKEDFRDLLSKYRQNEVIYIPMEEQTTDYVISFIESQGVQNLKCILPEARLYRTFRNKKELNKYCINNSIPAPALYDKEDLPDVEYPVILKPEIGSGSHGHFRLYSKADYTEDVKSAINRQPYLIQELLPEGKDVQGAFFLCYQGKVIDAYTHQRIRTSPEEGGVTVLSRITDNTELIQQGKALLEKAGWEGLIMLEYIYDKRSRKYKVIEANPRVWGSIMLSEFSGANLLSNYIRICMGEPIIRNEKKQDVNIRWLFPMDFLNLIKRKGIMKGFWDFKNTCIINWTYARKYRSLFFIFLSIINTHNIKKLVDRL